ncbi:cupin domain-containing protein [Nannocystis exedens]|uniref:cupin domain-containing protein n=1 Tax=Nannocystis exedens TaxID=54 RepID=UPI001FE29312|nr:cupin domain-containing protein [Nannocystis exedens]
MRVDDRWQDDRPVFVRHHHVGRWPRPPRPVVHEFAAMVFYVDGRAEVEQRGRVRVEAGDVQLVPAGEAHRMICGGGAEAWGSGSIRSSWPPPSTRRCSSRSSACGPAPPR